MKKILLLPLLFLGLLSMAQTTQSTSKTKKNTNAKNRREAYRSKNGRIKARTLDKYENADSVKAFDKDAEHINSNYNESVPPLSPNSGSSSPKENGK